MKFTPSKTTAKLSTISALVTFTLLVIEKFIGNKFPSNLFSINRWMIDESLIVDHSVPAIVIAMLPGLFTIILAITLKSASDKQLCLSKLGCDLNLETDLPDSFPPDRWLNTPAGVLAFYRLSEISLLKVGISITSTVAGASLYLFLSGYVGWWLFLAALLLAYVLSVFQNYITCSVVKILSK